MELHDQAVLPWGNAHRAQAREAAHRQTTSASHQPTGAPFVTASPSRVGSLFTGVKRAGPCRTSIRPGLSAELALHAMAVEFPQVHGHPNRLPFEGVLTLIDVPSDKAPSGARGHRVILTRAAAEAALPSLLGMAVDYKSPQPAKLPGDAASAGWDGHDARQKCGIITSAEIDGRRLTVAGYLFSRDFPEIEQRLGPEARMGMSYELADAHVADMSAQIWTLTRATFTGAAILLREKAAYRDTSFTLRSAKPGAESARSLPKGSTRVSRVDHGVTASG